MSKIAIVSAKGLGDALLTMTIAYNFHLKGYKVDFYSNVLSSMAEYFPSVNVLPFSEDETDWEEVTKKYEFCIFADGMVCPRLVESAVSRLFILNRDKQSRKVHYIESFSSQLKNHLSLDVEIVTMANGLVVSDLFVFRRHRTRIILHPTSSGPHKNWPMDKYVRLADKLRRDGFDPVFILTPLEEAYIQMVEQSGLKYVSLSLKDLVPYLYESGAMVANDSGPGHLGAISGIPLVSLFPKESRTVMWGPVGARVQVTTPPFRLPGRNGSRFWKHLLSVNRVCRILKRVHQL
jgi:heptosyltransferase-3